MPITIQEIIASDTISQFVDKTNFNFDQLLLNGGGPAGPLGIQGPIGPAGGRGEKGSTWYEDASAVSPGLVPTPTVPTTTPITGDYYLQFNGDVWEYIGTVWVLTTVNLTGPIGPAGSSGGFGLVFGASPSVLLNKNTLYNGQIGTTATGATVSNEGVPSIMMGGISSIYDPNTSPVPSPALTNAYVLPQAIESGLSSDVASVLIHQKNSSSKSIVFHGGNAIASDFFDQTSINNLSNISIGINDKLILDVPKAAEGVLSGMSDLIGFQVDSQFRSQAYNAGQQIRFVTGQDGTSYGLAGENSNFEISVGAGSTGTANKFKVNTLSSGSATSMEMGGNIALLTDQITNTGTYQLLSGITRFVTTTTGAGTGEFSVRAQGNISLNTDITNAYALANIGLFSRAGGITANSIGGAISITQTEAASASNIQIDQQSTVGNLYIRSNSNIILKNFTDATALTNPSITLDYSATHTRVVGKQTWGSTSQGATVQPFTNVQQSNAMGALLTSAAIFRQVGQLTSTNYSPGSIMEKWIGGGQTATGLDAGLITIINANEGPLGLIPADKFMYDNSLELSIRNSTNAEEYISLSKSKLGLATPIVHKRARGLNSTTNSTPSSGVGNGTNNGQTNYLNQYGWDTSQTLAPATTTGMPTTEGLNVPFITLAYGRGMGLNSIPHGTPEPSNIDYDYSFEFPTGGYPGQQLILKFMHYASQSSTATDTTSNYGKILVKIPQYRRRAPDNGNNAWSDWWSDNILPASPHKSTPSYYSLVNTQDSTNATEGLMTETTLVMVWDGGVVELPGASFQAVMNNAIRVQQEMGWIIVSSITQESYLNYEYPAIPQPPAALAPALRTLTGQNTQQCSVTPTLDVFIDTATPGQISEQDTAYITAAGINVFQGGNTIYHIILNQIGAGLIGDVVCSISDQGKITNILSCITSQVSGLLSSSTPIANCVNSGVTPYVIFTHGAFVSNGDVMMNTFQSPAIPVVGDGDFYTFNPFAQGLIAMSMRINASGVISNLAACQII